MNATLNHYTLAPDGYFARDGRRFVPAGVNYWPASCGVEMWPAWPVVEIERDLDVLVENGLNTVRFFLRWQDFEPTAGVYEPAMFARLRHLLAACRARGLAAHPSLFVGWMSGGVFWPDWFGGRNLFADPFLVERGVAFARAATAAIAEFKDCVLAIDQGNELCCLPESRAARPADVIGWCGRINAAVREAWPDAVVVGGHEQTQVTADSGFRLGDQPGCDLYSMHGYPVPGWHTIAFDGMADPLAGRLLPLYIRMARTFGPTMLQEFGTIVAGNADRQDAFLRNMLPAAWASGASGFLYWCMRDVAALAHPYVKVPFESTLGLIGDDDRIRPALRYFGEFAATLPTRAAPTRDARLALYLPTHFYDRDAPANVGNAPGQVTRWIAVADHLLRTLGHAPAIVRGDLGAVPGDVKTLVIAGAKLDLFEVLRLAEWVRAGGRLIWHGVPLMGTDWRTAELLGAVPADHRAARPATIDLFGDRWAATHYAGGSRGEFDATTAEVLAADGDGVGQVFLNRLGRGAALWTIASLEESVAAVADQPAERDRWTAWYRGALDAVAHACRDATRRADAGRDPHASGACATADWRGDAGAGGEVIAGSTSRDSCPSGL